MELILNKACSLNLLSLITPALTSFISIPSLSSWVVERVLNRSIKVEGAIVGQEMVQWWCFRGMGMRNREETS